MHSSKGICNKSVATVSAEVWELPTRPYSPTNTRCIKTQPAIAQPMNCGRLNRSTRRIGANKTRQGSHPGSIEQQQQSKDGCKSWKGMQMRVCACWNNNKHNHMQNTITPASIHHMAHGYLTTAASPGNKHTAAIIQAATISSKPFKRCIYKINPYLKSAKCSPPQSS
ncbi:hypothetical protein F511_42122 [Dorcoceras hygrometricum]|uniref:Uncharacterized protein n=1 Tax=Dorcoceras hygrometricum TaxID=472368 RepID=A0A2Z7D0I0_9LAMI|nr:hypothetical protein F511_42122 [Dorcoceras hygrometricum]